MFLLLKRKKRSSENGFDLHVPGHKLFEHFRAFPLHTEGKPKGFEVLISACEINLHIKSTYPIKLGSQIESSDEVGSMHCNKSPFTQIDLEKKNQINTIFQINSNCQIGSDG